MKGSSRIACAVLCVFVLSGCSVKTGKPIPVLQVATIEPGKTVKKDLFTQFGAPDAILGRGEIGVIKVGGRFSGFYYTFFSDTFFELFPADGRQDEHDRIYYYRHVVSTTYTLPILLLIIEGGRTRTDQLWVLMNESTGTVDDYAFRQHGTKTVFGRHRGPDRVQNTAR